jgi:AraC family transcriptional regulator
VTDLQRATGRVGRDRAERAGDLARSTALAHRVQVARAHRFLRANATEPLELATIARVAGASVFHFARMYRSITGETVGAALTRLRVERAAHRLASVPHRPVGAIALEVGYQTPSALDKAFRKALGTTPTRFRAAPPAERRALLRALEAARRAAPVYELSLRPALRTAGDMHVICVRDRGDYAEVAAPLAWASLEARVAGTPLARRPRIAASYDDPETCPRDALRYDAGVLVDGSTRAPAGTTRATWRGGRFAVYELRGNYGYIAHAFVQIFTAWKLRRRPGPCLELYRPPDLVELWIPIKE